MPSPSANARERPRLCGVVSGEVGVQGVAVILFVVDCTAQLLSQSRQRLSPVCAVGLTGYGRCGIFSGCIHPGCHFVVARPSGARPNRPARVGSAEIRCAVGGLAQPEQLGQLLTAPHEGHQRVLTLNENKPAMYPTDVARTTVTR